MPLPKYELPKFKHKLYTVKKPIEYRAFTVGEQKELLLAKEANDPDSIIQAMKNIVAKCTFNKINADTLAFFDLEDLFLRIRSRSVSNESVISYKIKDTKDSVKVTINLDDVKLDIKEDHSNVIKLTDSIGLVLNYPTLDMMYKSEKEQRDLLLLCVDSVYDGDSIISRSDITDDELSAWLSDLDFDALKKIKHFFDTMPRIRHEVEVKFKKDDEQKTQKIVLEGIDDFFA